MHKQDNCGVMINFQDYLKQEELLALLQHEHVSPLTQRPLVDGGLLHAWGQRT